MNDAVNSRLADVPRPSRCVNLPTDPRGYPIIATVPQGDQEVDFGALSEPRKLAVACFDLCAICAKPFRDELRWQVTFDKDLNLVGPVLVNEAPVHEICGLYAAQICPYVSSPYARLGDSARKGQRRPKNVVLAGFARTIDVFGQVSELQPGVGILMFKMADLVRTHVLGSAAEASDAYEAALGIENSLPLDTHEQRLLDLLTHSTEEGEDSGLVMAGAASFIGAAFCPGISKIRSLARFADQTELHFQLASRFLLDPARMAEFEAVKDPSTAASIAWFRSRAELPDVLTRWRKSAPVAARRSPGRSANSRSTAGGVATAKRKSQKVARRKNRK